MVFFFENGGLGNQIFQYIGLKKTYHNSKIILFGFDSLKNVMEIEDVIILTSKFYRYQIFKNILKNVFKILSFLRIITLHKEIQQENNYVISKKRGIFYLIVFFESGFFQDNSYKKNITINIQIKKKLINQATQLLSDIVINNNCNINEIVFLHVRRGDYVLWPNSDFPAVLPAFWYLNSMRHFKKILKKPLFLIFTNDKPYVNEIFAGENICISTLDEYLDFSLMSLCKYGILSASSFSWWASYFSYQSYLNLNHNFIAPKYWIGHRVKKWNPDVFDSKWITFTDVEQKLLYPKNKYNEKVY
jgi:hypothetical protein